MNYLKNTLVLLNCDLIKIIYEYVPLDWFLTFEMKMDELTRKINVKNLIPQNIDSCASKPYLFVLISYKRSNTSNTFPKKQIIKIKPQTNGYEICTKSSIFNVRESKVERIIFFNDSIIVIGQTGAVIFDNELRLKKKITIMLPLDNNSYIYSYKSNLYFANQNRFTLDEKYDIYEWDTNETLVKCNESEINKQQKSRTKLYGSSRHSYQIGLFLIAQYSHMTDFYEKRYI